MKKFLLLSLFVFLSAVVFAQLTVVSMQPANNTKNVPLTTTISITFSEAIDTLAMASIIDESRFSSLDNVTSDGYSADLKTMFANVILKPNQSYFVALFYMKAKSGALLASPFVYYFTTGADFAPYAVSGTVFSGSSGVSPEGSVVGISNVNIMKDEGKEGPPPFISWTNVNSNGTYTAPYLSNGTYWPVAIKDVNHDGMIDPNNGVDVIAFADSIIINNASVNNHNLTFMTFTPKSFQEVISIADSLAKNLPADKSLRRISGWDVDTLGRSESWEFAYIYNNNTAGETIRISTGNSSTDPMDQGYIDWIKMLKPITGYQSAASSVTVIANAENGGGKTFRQLPLPDSLEFRIELSIADQRNGWFGQSEFDTSKIYWSVAYTQVYQMSQDQSIWVKGKFFLCDLATGAILLTQTMTDVKSGPRMPEQFSLSQNYPNPFNPSTMINYQLPANSFVTLKVYDMLGKEVAGLVNETKEAGDYTVKFDASKFSSGLYIYKLTAGKFSETKKMLLLK